MKDKVLNLRNGKDYCVLEELVYDNRKFVLTLDCDIDEENMNEENLYIMEIKIINDELVVYEVNDDILVTKVVMLFREKLLGTIDV